MHRETIDICVIEDDPAERQLLTQRLLRREFRVVCADDGPQGLQLIYRHRPKVIVCDVGLPDLDGIEICRRVRSDPTLDGVYFVLVTAFDSNARKKAALTAGADDYLCKPYDPEELWARIRNGMRIHRLQERLQRAALTDGLTDLWNHTQFRNLLDGEFARTRRYGGVLSLLMIDLDHFKSINDALGHEVGNQVLRLFGAYLARNVRDADLVARYGGEEFAVICPWTGLDEAAQLAERLRDGIVTEVRLAKHPQLEVRASFGVSSTSDPRADSVTALIDLSDQALYYSKSAGRNRVTRCDRLGAALQHVQDTVDEADRLRKELRSMTLRSKELCLQSVWSLIQALDARDRYSAWHSRNVMLYTRWLVDAAGWPKPLRTATANAAMLHDLGKIGLPDDLLFKPRPLNEAESITLREVPLITCRILEPLHVFNTEISIIRHLREWWDGNGTPDGLRGAEIPLGSRLLAVTEAFDSLTCNRAYRPGRTIDEALAELRTYADRQFDPQFVELLAETIERQKTRWQERVNQARVELASVAPAKSA